MKDRANRLAFGWGLAEATVFFLVPDVWLTRLALSDFRRALVACCWSLAGAIPGGVLLWLAGRHGLAPALFELFDHLPGISRGLIAKTGRELAEHGWFALGAGALAGQPYKLFAVHAGAGGLALLPFVAASLVARFARFTLTTGIAALAGWTLKAKSTRFRHRLHLTFWLVFYAAYFTAMRG